MNPRDQFHVGVVVDDLDAAMADLSSVLGYEWADVIGTAVPVQLPDADIVLDLRFAYSRSTPRLEVIRSTPGTLWVPTEGSGIHHLGYWSDDVPADAAALEQRGFAREATGHDADGVPYWAYVRSPAGPRIELVSRSIQPSLEAYWGGAP